jgi:hypothetical protein
MKTKLAFLCLVSLIAPSLSRADEGMWTFDNPPLKLLKEKYNFTPGKEWLDHIRLSSVRFNDGGSGSFVSSTGLVLTNHHVALSQLQKISTPEKNYVRDGFYARTPAEELKSADSELNVLVSYENVTDRVGKAARNKSDNRSALEARRAEIAKIEKESLEATGLRSDVVSLYQGGEYWLYRYKRYTDVRLVFAPEQQAAFYGGDPDNFTYPRYDLDMAIFRVYEDNKAISTPQYLKWNIKGAADGDLVFVSGHPGSTDRLDTMSEIELQRDYLYPLRLETYNRRLAVLRRYAGLGAEQQRQATELIFGLENSLKAVTGEYEGLKDREVIAKKQKEESDFRALINSKPEWKSEYGDAWDQIAAAEKKAASRVKNLRLSNVERSLATLPSLAIAIVQYATEIDKPDSQRLNGFHDSQLESLKLELLSPAPAYPQLDEALLADFLQDALDGLGPNDPFVKTALDGRQPAEVAKAMIAGTKLADVGLRKSLIEGGAAAVAASNDSLIVFARKVEPLARETRKWIDENVESVVAAAGEKIGKARFAAYGKDAYPDATFTLRLSYGTIKGYPMNGTKAPPLTTFYGLYDRAQGFGMKPPFDLPERFAKGKDRLDLSTPLNFVSTCDIIGGNSGSPVIDRDGNLVGLIFDGNIESLVGRYVYNIESNRAVAVHTAAMIEALKKLYDAGPLASELTGS